MFEVALQGVIGTKEAVGRRDRLVDLVNTVWYLGDCGCESTLDCLRSEVNNVRVSEGVLASTV